MKTFISIDNLKIFARHGVFEQETVQGNTFEVAVSLEYDFTEGAETDNLDLTLNYAELTEIVKEEMAVPRKLIETVALKIQRRIMNRWPAVAGGSVSITKLFPPIPEPAPQASVTVKW